MPRLPRISPPFFDSCQSSEFRQKERGREKVDFFRLWRKRQKAEKTREISFSSFFAISEIQILLKNVASIYIEDKS